MPIEQTPKVNGHIREAQRRGALPSNLTNVINSIAQKQAQLGPNFTIVHDRERRVTMFDTASKDPWIQKHGVGFMTWNDKGQISWIQTQDEYLRKGVAQALLDHVRKNIRPDIHHSTDLSASGAGFAKADIARRRGNA